MWYKKLVKKRKKERNISGLKIEDRKKIKKNWEKGKQFLCGAKVCGLKKWNT